MQTTTPTTTTTPAPKMPAIMPTNEPLASVEDTLTTAIGAGGAVCAGVAVGACAADVLVHGAVFGTVVLVGVAKPQMLAPSEETFPAAHVVQPPRPVVGLYLPAEHAVHVIAAAWE